MQKILFNFLFNFVLFTVIYSQYNDFTFNHINANRGISDKSINCIIQDYKGYIWIGTEWGLNKYDGYTFYNYLSESKNISSIPANEINCIFEDSHYRLWIGTSGGLALYNRETDRFTRYTHNSTDTTTLGNNLVETIYEDRSGNLWVGHYDGFAKLMLIPNSSNLTKQEIKFKNFSAYPISKRNNLNWMFSICEDRKGNLWMANFVNGVYRFNPRNNKIKQYSVVQKSVNDFNKLRRTSDRITKVFIDNDSVIWVLLHSGGGLSRYDEATDKFINYKLKDEKGSYADTRMNTCYDVSVDENNTFWIATDYGLRLFNYKTNLNKGYVYTTEYNNGINLTQINVLYFDHNKGLWLGSLSNGIDYFNKSFIKYTVINPENYSIIKNKQVIRLNCNSENELFFQIYSVGSFKYIHDKNVLTQIAISEVFANPRSDIIYAKNENQQFYLSNKASTGSFNVLSSEFLLNENIKVTANGNAWGTNNTGLCFYDRNTNSTKLELDKRAFDTLIIDYFIDNFDSVWLTSDKGLYKLVKANDIKSFITDINFSKNLIRIDSHGNIWLIADNKLFEYNRTTSKYFVYGQIEGFSGNKMYSLEVDKNDNLWITSSKGISKFDSELNKFFNYDEEDGLPYLNFNELACCDNNGNIYFGSADGILIINPDNFVSNNQVPPVVISSFKLFNKDVLVRPDSGVNDKIFYLEHQISETKEIILSYFQNIISIEYAALNYSNPNKNQYAYYLEGLEKDWNFVGTRRYANYTGLQPGTYYFRVKASNNSNIWNEEGTVLKILIRPPYWQTWWFKLFLFSIILFFIYLFIRYRTYNIRRQKEELEFQVKERTKELFILNSTKDKFFSIIAHDLKNPFHAITCIADLMLIDNKKLSEKERIDLVSSIRESSSSATALLENLLQWARSQSTKVDIVPTQFDLHTLVLDSCSLLKINADKKMIMIINNVPDNTTVFADRNMIDTVIRNLINNAIKFSNKNTEIKVSSTSEENFIIISVVDQGVGISSEVAAKLFRIDQNIANKGTSGESGTGLGLIICQDFIQKNNGMIWLESEQGKGTTFFVRIPMGEPSMKFIKESNIIHEKDEIKSISKEEAPDALLELLQDKDETTVLDEQKNYSILLIDDNKNIIRGIREFVKESFTVFEAENGKLGLQLTFEKIPDIIVCDWMMPEMDGIMFCNIIKKDERTSHIPCILLTARNTSDDEFIGLKTGADDYITKPFNINNLIIKINNILSSRKKFREKFARDNGIALRYESSNETDGKFMEKLNSIINKNITNPELDYEFISKEIGMGRAALYKKVKALTNLSVHGYIKKIRLHKAAEILMHDDKNISEVAYLLCFSNPNYFTSCFTELFGKSPSRFIADNRK